jgi:hypothetical protein
MSIALEQHATTTANVVELSGVRFPWHATTAPINLHEVALAARLTALGDSVRLQPARFARAEERARARTSFLSIQLS